MDEGIALRFRIRTQAGASLRFLRRSFVILPWLRSVPPGAWAVFDLLILLSLATPWKEQILQFLS